MGRVSVYKDNSSWRYRFEGAKINGKRTRIEKRGFRTKKDAEAAGNKALAEYANSGRCFIPSEISVSDYFAEWLAFRSVELKQTTIHGYQKRIDNYIVPVIGRYKLRAIHPANLQALLNDMFNRGFSRNTLTSIKGILSNAFAYAVEPLQYIQSSPMTGVRLPSVRATPPVPQRTKRRTAITVSDWNKLIARFPFGSTCYIPLMLGYHCGLRLGEAFGLLWDDIDFDAGTLTVNHQVQEIEKQWTIVLPKYESVRTITLDNQILSALRAAHEAQMQNKAEYAEFYTDLFADAAGTISDDASGTPIQLVNVRENGEFIQPRVTQHLCKVAHTELSLPGFDFHTLRHTHATMLIEAGVSPLIVQERLGHKNIQTTLDIYTSVTDKMRDAATDTINEIYT